MTLLHRKIKRSQTEIEHRGNKTKLSRRLKDNVGEQKENGGKPNSISIIKFTKTSYGYTIWKFARQGNPSSPVSSIKMQTMLVCYLQLLKNNKSLQSIST